MRSGVRLPAMKKRRYVISVLIPDTVGILHKISSAVTGRGGNIDSLSQTVVEGYFTVILTATYERNVTAELVQGDVKSRFSDSEAQVAVRPFVRQMTSSSGERCVLTVTGRDAKGVVKAVTGVLASLNINIEDWFMNLSGRKAVYVGEVVVPAGTDLKRVKALVRGALSDLDLKVSLQSENIFRATNDIGSVHDLLEK